MEATIRGNLGANPELATLPSGTVAARLRIAAAQNQIERDKNNPTVWLDVRAYGDLASRCAETLHTGDPVLVIGHWRAEEWEADDGGKRRRTYIYATGAGPDLSRCSVTGVSRPAKQHQQESGQNPEPPADPFDED